MKFAGLLGAAAALITMTAAQAAPDQVISPVSSYRDLLDPVPNVLPQLKADDEARQARMQTLGTKLAQISVQEVTTTIITTTRELG